MNLANSKQFWYHVIFWVAVFLFFCCLFVLSSNYKAQELFYTLCFVSSLAISSYVSSLFLVPKYLLKRKYALFALLFTIQNVMAGGLIIGGDYIFIYPNMSLSVQENYWRISDIIYGSVLLIFLFTSAFIGFQLLLVWNKNQKQILSLENEKIQTELNFLKSQMNPHFLFNSINLIYGNISKENKVAKEIVIKFSEILRYQIYDCSADLIDIEKEVTYLKSYFGIQNFRKNNILKANLFVSEDLQSFRIAPLIFLPFIENGFKHSSNYENQDNTLDVKLYRENGSLHFYSHNTKDLVTGEHPKNNGGLGIANVVRRLDLIYKDSYALVIKDEKEFYQINLKIKL